MGDLLHSTAHESLVHRLQIRRDIPNPAAGNDFTITVPGDEDWRLLAVTAQFVTSAVVANRVPSLVIDDQTTVGARCALPFVFTNSQSQIISWVAGYSDHASIAVPIVFTTGMPYFVLPGGYRARMLTANLDPGDSWLGISYMIEILSEPPYRTPMIGTAYDDEIEHAIAQRLAGG